MEIGAIRAEVNVHPMGEADVYGEEKMGEKGQRGKPGICG